MKALAYVLLGAATAIVIGLIIWLAIIITVLVKQNLGEDFAIISLFFIALAATGAMIGLTEARASDLL